MGNDITLIPGALNNVIKIGDERIESRLDRVVRGTAEEKLGDVERVAARRA